MGQYWQEWWGKNSYSLLTICSHSRIVEARSFHKTKLEKVEEEEKIYM